VESLGSESSMFVISLDGRPARTARKSKLVLPSKLLAAAIACEWAAQGFYVLRELMPLTMLAGQALDVVPAHRDQICDDMVRFAASDVASYRTPSPQRLRDAQDAVLAPALEHVASTHGVKLPIVEDFAAIVVNNEDEQKLRKVLSSMNDFELAAFQYAAGAGKSIVLALCLRDNFFDAASAAAASRCEEDYQASSFGLVEGSHDVDAADTTVRYAAAAAIFRLCALETRTELRA